jgi:hypothetical protein
VSRRIGDAGSVPNRGPQGFQFSEVAPSVAKRAWARLIKQGYEVDRLLCARCRSAMRVIAFIEQPEVIAKILAHLGLCFALSGSKGPAAHSPPVATLAAQSSCTPFRAVTWCRRGGQGLLAPRGARTGSPITAPVLPLTAATGVPDTLQLVRQLGIQPWNLRLGAP